MLKLANLERIYKIRIVIFIDLLAVAAQGSWKKNILTNRQMWVQNRVLKNEPYLPGAQRLTRIGNTPGVGFLKPRNNTKERRFTGSGCAHQRHHLARLHLKVDLTQNVSIHPKTLRDTTNLKPAVSRR